MRMERRPTVLVAEDHPVNQKVMSILLSSFSVDGRIVSNGREAVDALADAHTYALVFMDIMMPEMDGFEASIAIRKREFGKGVHTPIVAVTAVEKGHIEDRCVRSGIDDYICKPYSAETLRQKIEMWTPIKIIPTPIKQDAEMTLRQFKLAEEQRPIDEESIKLIYGLEEVDDIVTLFLAVTETLLAQLDTAIKQQDAILVRRMAHEIKGSSYAVSAREMANLCKQLEKNSEEKDWPEVMRTYATLGTAFTRVRQFLSDKNAQFMDGMRRAS